MATTVDEIRMLLQTCDEREFEALKRSLEADTRKGVVSAVKTAERRITKERAERQRLEGLYCFDRSHLADGQSILVGLDEVGRGSVAGPLAVGAVVLDLESPIGGLDDSKKLTPEKREQIAQDIEASCKAWAVFYVEPADIDRYGMSACLRRAFSGAVERIEESGFAIDVVLIDGNPLGVDSREVNVVKGDRQSASIAAASIIAKVKRDSLMCDLAERFPEYGFDENKGYGSQAHADAIRKHGLSEVHRASFCRGFLQETLF